ncbi:glycoside hydrolase family 3 [Parapedobacter sp. ISTM3]|uniref:glycoside hydrolase family 3 protein n=1 Tax=Parapedobacter sp. ISTM3 TaxID=2800130 RepID=UPI0019032916|nr:glycoside hydrolase family 3 N-terminal domain-containing protein [Parapedobacter sp. ISTM3]MBK1441380.1 glycoside hydrolase family 3 [Parapedobacter sp. ISTM3]
MLRKALVASGLILSLQLTLSAQQRDAFIPFINAQHRWVDSVFNTLSARDKVAQLFMVRAHSDLGQRYIDSVAGVIQREQLGGIVLFQGGPVRHAQVINRYQRLSKVPLLVAFDGEWGLGMRLADSTISFPYQMALGAIQNEALIYQMGLEVARDFKRLGMNVNFAPVVDINNNPRNPVINFRSFGEDKQNVTRKGLAYMRGMMDAGLLTTLKHFPGHGDTDVDSHYDLPRLTFTAGRLDSLEMYPFRELIKAGAPGVMVAHMNIPSLDKTPNLPSSLSHHIITNVLKKRFGFQGLTFTDAMDMRGVVKHFRNGEADVRAIIAGNDVLELSENSGRAINLVLQAIKQGRLSQQDIDTRVKKILAAKYWLGLDNQQQRTVNLTNLYRDINRPQTEALNQRLADASVTLLKSDSLIKALDYTKRTAVICIGLTQISEFQNMLGWRFDNNMFYVLSPQATADDVAAVANELSSYSQVIVALHDNRIRPRSTLNYNGTVRLFINELANMNSVFCLFANPYSLAGLPGIEQAKTILVCYQNDDIMQRAAAKVILKRLNPTGRLPVTVNSFFRYGDGK